MKHVIYLEAVMFIVLGALNAGATGEGWFRDFEKAKSEAARRQVPILVDFSGSDWCFWCKKLDEEVLSTSVFKEFADKNMVLFLADFPSQKQLPASEAKQNEKLASKFGIEGYPTVLLLDAEGKILGRTGYRRGGAESYVKHIKSLLADPK